MRNGKGNLAGVALAAILAAGPVSVAAQSVDPNVTPYPATFFAEFRPQTAFDMIGRIPGFQFDGGSSGRGFSGTVGNVLIDGVRPPVRTDSLQAILQRIPVSQVERIEIVRGGAGGIDMAGKPVVANVIRRAQASVTGAYGGMIEVNRYGQISHDANVQIQRQSGGRLIDAALSVSDDKGRGPGFRDRRSPVDDVLLQGRIERDFRARNARATGVYEGGLLGGQVRLNGLVDRALRDSDRLDLLLRPGGTEVSASDNEQLRGELGVRFNRALPRGAALELIGSLQRTHGDNDSRFDTDTFASLSTTKTRSGESIGAGNVRFATLATPLGGVDVEAGSELVYNFVNTDTDLVRNGLPLNLPGNETEVEELRSETYVSGVWALRDTLSVTTAMRLERSRIVARGSAGDAQTDLAFLKPRLNASWTPRPGHSVVARLERNVDQLSFAGFRSSAAFATGIFGRGNPDLRPAQVWLGSLRYERLFGGQGSLVAEATHEAIDDVIGQVVVFETPPGETRPRAFNVTRNVGTAQRSTARVNARLPLDAYGMGGGILSGGLVARASSTQDPVTLVDRRLSGEQPIGWSLGLTQNLGTQRINWSLSASGGAAQETFAPSNLSRSSGGPNFNGNVTWRPDGRLSVSAGVNVRGDEDEVFTLFGGPRDRADSVYAELSTERGSMNAYVTARRTF